MSDLLVNLLFLLVVAAVFVGASLLLRARWLLAVAVCSSVFQLHWPIAVAGIFPPLTLGAVWLLWPRLAQSRRALLFLPAIIVMALLATWTISLAWAVDVRSGVRTLVYAAPFVLVFAAAFTVARRRPGTVECVLTWFSVFALVEAALVVVFRVNPGLEQAYLKSRIAGLFISPNTLEGLYSFAANNVRDPAKAGGFFVSANPAAAFLGVSAFIAAGVACATRRRWLLVVAAMLWGAVFFTGSKAGMILALALLLLAVTAWILLACPARLAERVMLVALLATVVVAGVAGAVTGLDAGDSRFFSQSRDTLQMRRAIWGYAARVFRDDPLRGQGFGGWEAGFPKYAVAQGLATGFPPHNTFIALWSQAGLLAGMLGGAFMVVVVRFGWHAVQSPDTEARLLAIGTTCAFLWIFVQGMGENFGLLGDLHMQPPLAAALALTYARHLAAQERPA